MMITVKRLFGKVLTRRKAMSILPIMQICFMRNKGCHMKLASKITIFPDRGDRYFSKELCL